MATPHNKAEKGKIAKTVLMPGDPLRSRYIAENFIKQAELVNDVRGVQGYTGLWRGVPVTVMASGMGIPSMGIYSWELFTEYDVENILRIGSAGALQDGIRVRDVVIAQAACTNSNYVHQFGLTGDFAPIGSYELIETAVQTAREKGLTVRVGNVLSSDTFYDPAGRDYGCWEQMGVMAVEMEAAGLYANAAKLHKRALCICTISDHLKTGEALDAEARQTSFNQMIELALDTAAKLG